MAPPQFSEEWNASCAQRPATIRDDSSVNPAYFHFNYFIMAFTLVYYIPAMILFWWKRRSKTSAYLAKRSFAAVVLAFTGCVAIVIVGPVRDNAGRQDFPCSATLWLRLVGVVNVVTPVLVRLNFFRQQVEWSKAMKSINVHRLQALANSTGHNGGKETRTKERPSLIGMLFGHTPSNSNKVTGNEFVEEVSQPGTPSGSVRKTPTDRESKSAGGQTLSVSERDGHRVGMSSSSGMDSKDFQNLLYKRSFRYNLMAIGLPLLPLVAAGFGFEFGLAYNRANCNGCYEELWFFLVIGATVGAVINLSAYYAYQLRKSPDPLFMLHELKMLVLTASLPGGLGAGLTAFDNYVDRIYDRGVFSWDWLVILALMIEFFWLCLHPLYVNSRAVSKVSGAQVDFQSFLTNPRASKLFAEHLTNEWAIENLKFWNQVETFRSQYTSFRSKKEANLVAWQTYCSFIRPGAVLDINIPSSLRDQLINEFEAKAETDPELTNAEIPSSVFDQAQREVYTLMEKDSFQRFLKTPAYKAFANENTVMDATSQKLVVVADPLA